MCGCGTEVRSKWVRGHYARVNNPSKDPIVREKQSISAKKRIESGERSFAGRNVTALTFEEQGDIVDDIVRYHLENDIHGITLCRSCHDRIHAIDPDVD